MKARLVALRTSVYALPLAVIVAAVMGASALWVIFDYRAQRDKARGCALANQILNAIDTNRIVLEDTLSTLRDDRAEAAAAAHTDGQLADAARRQAAAQRYGQLVLRLQPIQRFDCEGG